MLARADHDFVLGQVRPARKAQKRRKLQALRGLFKRPGRVILGATGAAVGVGILVNALMMQGGPHPAPLFHTAATDAKPASSAPLAPKPLPPARPAELAQAAMVATTSVAPTVPAASAARSNVSVAPAAAPVAPPAPVVRDPIADMLRGGAPAAQPAVTASVEPSRSVLAAQRALNKLNYGPIKPDGLAGPGTRQAIERFERDRKLPVTGEVGGRTARELAAASGIAID